MPSTQAIQNDLLIDGDALSWRLAGLRPESSQQGALGRAANYGQHAKARKNERERWQFILLSAKRNADGIDAWICPRPAKFVIYMWGPSPPDSLNMGWHAKYAADAMVKLGFIANDSPKYAPRTESEIIKRPAWARPGPGMELRIEPY